MRKTWLFISGLFGLLYPGLNPVSGQVKLFHENTIVSSYIWRGQVQSNAVNVQPGFSLTLANGNLKTGLWGSYATNGSFAETNLFLSWHYGNFSVTLFDYFVPSDETVSKFFQFDQNLTAHSFEIAGEWLLSEEFPVTLLWATAFWGNDFNENNNRQWSSYFEISWENSFQNFDAGILTGLTPWQGIYGEGFEVVNTGISITRDWNLTDNFSIFSQLQLTYNPYLDEFYWIIALGY